MNSRAFLLDVNALVALSKPSHVHHTIVSSWFDSEGHQNWGVCPLTEAGFLRLMTNRAVGGHALAEARLVLSEAYRLPGFRFWPITDSWTTLAKPFSARIFGHQQVTDAYLLGLAIKEDGVLVTFDAGLRYMAGAEFSRNVLILGCPV